MPEEKLETNKRKKMVVEEVVSTPTTEQVPTEPQEETKEKPQEVEEPTNIAPEPTEVSPVPTTTHSMPTDFKPQQNSGVNPFVIIIPGIFLLGGLLGGILFYQNKVSGTTPQATDSPTLAPVEAPGASSTPIAKEIDLTKYNINILNGSGIKGEAGKVQSLLEDAGFKVSGTGNATSYDYTKTVIQVKSDVSKDFIAKLTETLSEAYSVDTKTQSLSESSKESVVVIVGSTKK